MSVRVRRWEKSDISVGCRDFRLLSFARWKGVNIDGTIFLSVQKRDDSLELEEQNRRGRNMLI